MTDLQQNLTNVQFYKSNPTYLLVLLFMTVVRLNSALKSFSLLASPENFTKAHVLMTALSLDWRIRFSCSRLYYMCFRTEERALAIILALWLGIIQAARRRLPSCFPVSASWICSRHQHNALTSPRNIINTIAVSCRAIWILLYAIYAATYIIYRHTPHFSQHRISVQRNPWLVPRLL